MAQRSPNYEVIKHSVTKNDYNPSPYGGYGTGIFQLVVPYTGPVIGDLPPYWSPLRDRVLKTTPLREPMWASAIGIAISKVAASDWYLDGTRVKYWQELLLAADNNQSFVAFEEKQVRDFLLTDNGNHFEIIRVSNARGSRIIGIQHLPSWRVIRTGDIDIPVIYRDRMGVWHEMRDYQVASMADEPDPDDIYFGVGHCAASRAFSAIMKLSALELYIYEKVSGKSPNRIYLVNASINDAQLQNAIDVQREKSNQKGYATYQDAIIIPILDPSANASVAHIDLKGLPENYDADKERIHSMLTYADAIGLDPVDLDPNLAARGRALGSGSQAQVLDDKQQGKGLITYFKKKQHLLNQYVLPNRVTFSFGNSDLVDQTRLAQIQKLRAEAMRTLVGNNQDISILTPEQAKAILVDLGDVPPDFLSANLSDVGRLSDTDKVEVTNVEKEKKSLIQSWQEKAYKERVLRAEEWASQNIPEWWMMSEQELLASYELNHSPDRQSLSTKDASEIKPLDPNGEFLAKLLEAVKAKEVNPVINVTVPPIQVPAPNITLPPMSVNVTPPQVHVVNQVPVPSVNVEAPSVTVESPQVNVEPPQVNIQPPEVHVPSPQVNVHVPESPAPTVHVEPNIHVALPNAQTEVVDVERNKDGFIERLVKTIRFE